MKIVNIRKSAVLMVLFPFLLLTAQVGFSQSAYLPNGVNGVLLESDTTINTNFGVRSSILKTGFSIAGILDISLYSGLLFEQINSFPASAVDLELSLGAIILKEAESVPFSVRLRASYGYTRFVSNEYLTRSYLRRSGMGYEFALTLMKNFSFSNNFAVHAELTGGVRSYNFITESIIPAVDYSLPDDKNRVFARTDITVPFRITDTLVIIPGVKAEYDLDNRFYFGPLVGILIPTS